MKKLGLILVFLLTQLGGAIASDFKNHHGHDHRHCQSLLQHSSVITPGDIRITNSGQDLDLQPNLQEAARIMYHELAPKVGITIPQMTITSLSASDMAALSSTAGHPMPHWTDGRKVANGAKGAAGIYEFVVPGQRVHHQFVRDTNNFHDTLIVYAHVGGHYDFAEHSILFKSRDPDQIRYSYELSQLMSRNYTLYGKTEVSEFYQFLLTMAHAQDLSRGSFDPPEFFDPTAMGRQSVVTRPKQGFISGESEIQYANLIHPRRPSESELQAFVRNLPSTIEPWKREMAEVFEKNNRVVPAYLNTKVLNEGWATILEYILLAHSPWNSSADAVKFGQLNAGVNRPSLSNPYWLGSQAWLQVRERFLERPEIKNLSPIEQDRLFVEEAHRIIEQSSDYSFINYALDKNWVEKHNLLLYRTVDRAPGEKTNMAISRDPKRVVRWIANKIANHDLHFPKIEIKDFNSRAEGVVLLNHKPVFGVPLDRSTVAKALFVRAKLLERPVAIETIGSRLWEKPRPPERRVPGKPVAPPPYHPLDTYPIRITVSPKGEVKVESEVNAESLQALYQQTVDAYRFDISLSLEPGRVHAELE